MRSVILILLMSFVSPVTGISQETEKWNANFKSSIRWSRITPLGFLIVNSGAGLHGVDPESGEITWTHSELANAPESSFRNLEGTPFAAVNGSDGSFYMIEPIEGSTVFSSKASGIETIDEQYFLYKSGAIMILGKAPGSDAPGISMIDMTSGETLWSKSSEFGMVSACYDLNKTHCLVSTLFFMFKIDIKTGEVAWKKSLDPKFEKLAGLMGMLDKGSLGGLIKKEDLVAEIIVTEKHPTACYIGAQNKTEKEVNGEKTITYSNIYNAFDLETGEYLWERPVEFRDKLGTTIGAPRGLVTCPVSAGNSRINVLDYKTGQTILGKKGRGVTVKGSVLGYSVIKEGILVNTRVLSGSSSNNYIYLLHKDTQEPLFKKPAKLKGDVARVIRAGKNLIVITDSETNVYDPATGILVLDKAIKGGHNLATDTDEKLYLFNSGDNLMYAISKTDGSVNPHSGVELKFEGKEDPKYLELRENGIVVSAEQNLAMIGYDGDIKFQKYLPAPRLPGITRALLAANAIRAAYIGAVSGYASAAFGAASHDIKVEEGDTEAAVAKGMTQGMSQVYGELSDAGFAYADKAFRAMNTRFKATTESNTSMLMMVDKGNKVYGLQEISKDDGNEGSFIDMGKDKEPVYEVDAVANRIYYRKNSSQLVCYTF